MYILVKNRSKGPLRPAVVRAERTEFLFVASLPRCEANLSRAMADRSIFFSDGVKNAVDPPEVMELRMQVEPSGIVVWERRSSHPG